MSYVKKDMSLSVSLMITTSDEHLMPSGIVFHSVAAAVSINRLPCFTVLLLLGTNDVVFANLRCLAGWYQFNSSHRYPGASL